ncbi:hypothetical protein RJT34_06778 [Clitoria ternatea]|uniref:Uncharacterized protein n=1 Tax=Clitoria ternatea TaxID=43366 RepID=A0AAN9K2U2_CLITE
MFFFLGAQLNRPAENIQLRNVLKTNKTLRNVSHSIIIIEQPSSPHETPKPESTRNQSQLNCPKLRCIHSTTSTPSQRFITFSTFSVIIIFFKIKNPIFCSS